MKTTIKTLEKKMDDGFKRLEEKIEGHIESHIDGLAIIVKNGFDDVYRRFDLIDQRFDQMDKRFDRIENISIGGHERRIENLEDRVGIINKKLGISRR